MNVESLESIKDDKSKSLATLLQKTLKEHTALCKENTKNQRDYLKTVVEDLKERENNEHISINQLMHREQSRSDFFLIQNETKKKRSKGIRVLHISDPIQKTHG
jgi:gas vesicle protein